MKLVFKLCERLASVMGNGNGSGNCHTFLTVVLVSLQEIFSYTSDTPVSNNTKCVWGGEGGDDSEHISDSQFVKKADARRFLP